VRVAPATATPPPPRRPRHRDTARHRDTPVIARSVSDAAISRNVSTWQRITAHALRLDPTATAPPHRATKAIPNNNRFRSLPPRRHGPAQSLPDSQMSGYNPEHHRAAARLCAINVLLPPHSPCSSCLRIVNVETAEHSTVAEEKTGMATSRAGPTHVAAGTAKNAPLPKSPINSSLRTLRPAPRPLRLVRTTFHH
jgi:hypothetical protein